MSETEIPQTSFPYSVTDFMDNSYNSKSTTLLMAGGRRVFYQHGVDGNIQKITKTLSTIPVNQVSHAPATFPEIEHSLKGDSSLNYAIRGDLALMEEIGWDWAKFQERCKTEETYLMPKSKETAS